MATRLKTIEYWVPATTSVVTDATVTNLTQITLYIPETIVNFRSVKMTTFFGDVVTATGGTITEYRTALRLAAVAYSTVTNLNNIGNSGENIFGCVTADFTSYFTTNWTGTSMTCDVQVFFDQNTGTTLGMRNVSAKIQITYEYDDTSSTHIKTVWLPLNAPVGALATTKPGTATASIPNLDTWCPEASKTFRQRTIVIQGNNDNAGTDPTISIEIDTLGVQTTGAFENGLATDCFFCFPFVNQSFTTNATHSFYLWGSAAHCEHLQAWMVITYEFSPGSSSTILNSIILPLEIESPMGGNTSSNYQRAERNLWIQEPTTITGLESGFFMFFEKAGAIGSLNARVGTGSFTAYTDGAAVLGGGSALMIPFTPSLSRGLNNLNVDVYRNDTADLGFNASGFFIINYTSGKASAGVGAHNHTVLWNIKNFGTAATALESIISATAPIIPEADFFFTAVGAHCVMLSTGTLTPSGIIIQVERLSGEGGVKWETLYIDSTHSDPEVGIRQVFVTGRSIFRRFTGDVESDNTRLNIETSRRYKIVSPGGFTQFTDLDLILTYHSISFTISGNITGSNGGTVNLTVMDALTHEVKLQGSRSGNGSYSFTWYDNTRDMYVVAYETDSYLGRSANDVAT